MDKKLKTKWLKALRSGRYKQGNYSLYRDGAYCCLGVLAKVQGAVARGEHLKLSGEDVRKVRRSDRLELLAPQFAAGIHSRTQCMLGAMNDGTGRFNGKQKDFTEIADYIEKKL